MALQKGILHTGVEAQIRAGLISLGKEIFKL